MIDIDFYKNLWGGDKIEGVTIPDYYVLFGHQIPIKDKESFYNRFGTIEGIQNQYKDFKQTVGLIYHLMPDGDIEKRAYEKSRDEIRADGHYAHLENKE